MKRLALFCGSLEHRGPVRGPACGNDELRPVEQRAGVEPRRVAEAAQEKLQLHHVALTHQSRERRPACEQARRRDRFLADPADFVARLVCGAADPCEGLFRGLVAQEAERGERDRHDREQHEAGDREQQQALERARPRQQAHEARFRLPREPQRNGLHLPQQRVQAQCPPVPERHSTRVLATRVKIASMARSEATAKAATKLYSL